VENGQTSIREFIAYWDEKLYKVSIPAGDVAGVRILTIHKAKGLAFHTVLMPACDWELEKDHREGLLWCKPAIAPFSSIPLVPIKQGSGMRTSIYAPEYATEHADQRTENLNLMYVAFTRARHGLYVWAKPHKEGYAKEKPHSLNMGDVLRACIDSADGYVSPSATGAPPTRESAATDGANPKTNETSCNPLKGEAMQEAISFSTFAPHVKFRQSSAARDFVAEANGKADADSRTYIDRGKLLHRVFSSIRTLADVDTALATLTQSGIVGSDAEAASLRQLVTRRITNPTVRTWFDGSWQVHNECNILSRTNGGLLQVRRPDRVMTRRDEAVVVDFKFGNAHPEYRDQVATYCRLLSQMGYAHIDGYLWYVYEGRIEAVTAAPSSVEP